MEALLGALGFVGLVIGIVLIILGLIKKKKYKGGLIAIISLVVVIIAVVITPKDSVETASADKPATEKSPTDQSIAWEDKIKKVAKSEGTEGEKFDTVSLYANDYKPTEDEIAEFEDYIIKEYKDDNYIMDISNHRYMLENIFKSQVVENYYKDEKQNPMQSFAFDFWQNSKYNYRGVDTMTSESTLSNEKQMDKALSEIN